MEAKKVAGGDLCGACLTEFAVTTTGFKGGDAGHGGYATLTIQTDGTTEISEEVVAGRIDITFFGHEEMRHFAIVLAKAGIGLASALGMTVAEVLGEDPDA